MAVGVYIENVLKRGFGCKVVSSAVSGHFGPTIRTQTTGARACRKVGVEG